ncbi:MAG: hypothetical protein WC879_11180 [Melioribacteraceae bacterium]
MKPIGIRKKSYLAFRFLDASIDFAKYAIAFEKERHSYNDEYFHYLFSSIILCVTFLESNINEFYSTIKDEENNISKTILVKNSNVIISLWDRGIPRTAKHSILDKYEIALDVTESNKIDSSCNPYQNVAAIIKLRNALIHYEPEWQKVSTDNNSATYLEKSLKGKYELSKYFHPKTEPFFPYLCLSGDCCLWAIKNSVEFVFQFYKNINVEIPFKRVYENTIKKISV